MAKLRLGRDQLKARWGWAARWLNGEAADELDRVEVISLVDFIGTAQMAEIAGRRVVSISGRPRLGGKRQARPETTPARSLRDNAATKRARA